MTRRWPLLLLFVALAATAFWLWRSNRPTTLSGNLADFVVPDTAKVSRIFIADQAGTSIDLRRTTRGDWTVNGMPADRSQVSTLLKTFLLVEVNSPVAKSAEATVLKVMSTTAKKVEIYQGGDVPVKIWWVGHATQDHLGTYVLLEKPGVGRSQVPFVAGMSGFRGTLQPRFHTRVDDWRSLELLHYPDLAQVQRVQVEHPGADTADFAITYKGGNDLVLHDRSGAPVAMDSMAVKDVLRSIRIANLEYVERNIGKPQRDSVLASRPWHVLTITSTGGEQRVRFWKKDPRPGELDMEGRPMVDDYNRMYAALDDTALVVVQRQKFDRIVPPLAWLKQRPANAPVPR